jgi:hypothetical protein
MSVEPATCVTLKYFAGLSAYLMYHPSDRYFPGLNTTGVAPIFAQYEHSEATDDDVAPIKLMYKLKRVAFALLIVGPLVGGILFIVGAIILFRWYKTHSRTFVKQIDRS